MVVLINNFTLTDFAFPGLSEPFELTDFAFPVVTLTGGCRVALVVVHVPGCVHAEVLHQ